MEVFSHRELAAVNNGISSAPSSVSDRVRGFIDDGSLGPLFLQGNSLEILRLFPAECVDCVMTSPPYWGQRQYSTEGIGLEADYRDYIGNLLAVFHEVWRVVKPSGSFRPKPTRNGPRGC